MSPNIGNNTAHVNGYVTAFSHSVGRFKYRMMLDDVFARVESRLAAVGLTASAASTKAGLSRDAIRNMRRAVEAKGRAGVSTKTIAALAPILETTPGWLLDGTGDEVTETIDVPLLSKISASAFRSQDGVRAADIRRHIKVSHLPPGDWFALEVEGTSMDRIAPDGSVIIVNRADDRLIDGKNYVFSLDDGAATFKQYRLTPDPMLVPHTWQSEHVAIPVGDRDLYVFGRVRRVITEL